MKTVPNSWYRVVRHALQEIAPYMSLFLMPGGSLMVLALLASRYRLPTAVRL